jgi:hypothetical protein
VTIAIVTLAGAIQWLVALAMIWVSAGTLAVAERCQLWPRAGLTLVSISERCALLARGMLGERP